nr:hypothetical protein [uncultured Desulfobacter sp.]
MKQRIEIGNSFATTVSSANQYFHSRVLAKNFRWILASPVQDSIVKNENEKKHENQLSMAQAISKSTDTLFWLFERHREIIAQFIKKLHADFMAVTELIRSGRKFKRKYRINKREHYMNCKPCL